MHIYKPELGNIHIYKPRTRGPILLLLLLPLLLLPLQLHIHTCSALLCQIYHFWMCHPTFQCSSCKSLHSHCTHFFYCPRMMTVHMQGLLPSAFCHLSGQPILQMMTYLSDCTWATTYFQHICMVRCNLPWLI